MKSALITIGATREYIDPVRYISNESSGLQGMAIIEHLIKNKIKTVCLCGHISTEKIVSPYIKYINVTNAKDMLKAAKKYSNVDIAIFNAAVSDYRVKKISLTKIKKQENLILSLIKNPDILLSISSMKKRPKIVVGFAYETNSYKTYAKKKLIDKNCDYLVLNYPYKNNKIFSNKRNNGLILNRNLKWTNIGNVTKKSFAKKIIQHIISNSND
ncbi:phosphopantothenoylcysteine decarboxylase [Alphaproteobacteria bacterium]|nr:phosphopantothenoylcysteine decarboxylase [Alphaproteobacteria bacterium]MDB4184177.1 phosphopantothenoylcysteine decarboxylase [Alphaproteobacteria bacterium]MDB9824490.1 phosphopantothenoylcysteine decarboxylase [Alphaproteobacteria bacterium]